MRGQQRRLPALLRAAPELRTIVNPPAPAIALVNSRLQETDCTFISFFNSTIRLFSSRTFAAQAFSLLRISYRGRRGDRLSARNYIFRRARATRDVKLRAPYVGLITETMRTTILPVKTRARSARNQQYCVRLGTRKEQQREELVVRLGLRLAQCTSTLPLRMFLSSQSFSRQKILYGSRWASVITPGILPQL
jgi:hypothetical protein